jgi:hypothetical protein
MPQEIGILTFSALDRKSLDHLSAQKKQSDNNGENFEAELSARQQRLPIAN